MAEDVTGKVKSLKTELRETIQLAQRLAQEPVVNQQALDDAIARAGKLRDDINDVNEQVNVLAGGSQFEKLSNSLGDVGSKILSLDFEGASQSAKRLADISKTITFKDAIGSVKDLGSTFLTLGKSLLTNPLFLIAGAITALVLIIGKALDKLGILKKVTDFVGKAFDDLMNSITEVVAVITDFLGITDEAERKAQKTLEKTAEIKQKSADKFKKSSEEAVQGIDNEIRKAELQGKSTEALQRKKLILLKEVAESQAAADKAAFEASLKKANADKKEIADLKEKARLSRLAAGQAYEDVKFFNEKTIKDNEDKNKKEKEDNAKKYAENKEKRKAAEKERVEAEIKYSRDLEDLKIQLLEDGVEKEIQLNDTKYTRLIEDTLRNEKLSAEKKKALNDTYEQLRVESSNEIRKKDEEEKLKAELEFQKALNDIFQLEKLSREELVKSNYDNEVKAAEERLRLGEITETQLGEIKKRLQLKLNEDLRLIEEDKRNRDLEAELNLTQTNFDRKVEILAEQRDILLENDQLTANERLRIEEEYNQKVQALEAQRLQQRVQLASDALSTIQNLTELFNKGNERQQKIAFNVNKAAGIAKATIDTFVAANSALATLPPPVGAIAAGVAIAAGLANVAKIASTKFESKSSSGGGSVGGGSIGGSAPSSSSSVVPKVNLFGSSNIGGSTSASGTTTTSQNINVNASISVEEITNTQARMTKLKELGSL